jgi:hypothetical protein
MIYNIMVMRIPSDTNLLCTRNIIPVNLSEVFARPRSLWNPPVSNLNPFVSSNTMYNYTTPYKCSYNNNTTI